MQENRLISIQCNTHAKSCTVKINKLLTIIARLPVVQKLSFSHDKNSSRRDTLLTDPSVKRYWTR